MIRITGPHAVTQLPGFSEGLFSVQDLSASMAVRTLSPQPGWSILDLCSAPGSKTTQIAELSRDAASVTATDIDTVRLERVAENIARLGLKSVTIVPHAQLEQATKPFDAILLDAPCSNTGVLSRRVEARFRVTAQAVKDIAAIQKGLLAKAAGLVKPGGRICYSTCSIQRRENQDMTREFLAGHQRLRARIRIAPAALDRPVRPRRRLCRPPDPQVVLRPRSFSDRLACGTTCSEFRVHAVFSRLKARLQTCPGLSPTGWDGRANRLGWHSPRTGARGIIRRVTHLDRPK